MVATTAPASGSTRLSAPAETSPTQAAPAVSATWDGLPPTSTGISARPDPGSMRATESPGIAGPASSPPRAAEPDPEHGTGGEDGGAEGDQRAGAPGGDRTSPGPRCGGRGGPGPRPLTRGRRERRVLDEDAPLQVLERSPRLDAQLVGEGPAAGGVALERLGLAAAPVQREHELAAEPLAQRMLVDERLELAHELGATARAGGRPRCAPPGRRGAIPPAGRSLAGPTPRR